MRKLETKDLWPLPAYEGVRDEFRREVIAPIDAAALQKGPAAIVVDHPAYTHRQKLSEAARIALARDLVPEGS